MMKNKSLKYLFFLTTAYYLLSTVFIGCATTSNIVVEKKQVIFYPPPPQEARLQFLTSISSARDLTGKTSALKKFIVGEDTGDLAIVKPYGVAVYKGKIYLCDTVNNSIDILDLGNKKFEYFKPKDNVALLDPINLAFAENGDMYVADSRLGQVVIFDIAGNYLGSIGKSLEMKPTAVALYGDKVYVSDLKNGQVKVFDKRSQFSYSIPKDGAKDEAKLFSPTNIAIDDEGNLYVSDTGAFRVQKYGPDGDFLMTIGSHGDALGQFARPKGIAVDGQGRVYVVDAAFENIQIFDKDGKLLLFFAGPGTGAVSMVLPAGIAIDYSLKDYFSSLIDPSFSAEYLVLATSQYGDKKLNIFAFGSRKEKSEAVK